MKQGDRITHTCTRNGNNCGRYCPISIKHPVDSAPRASIPLSRCHTPSSGPGMYCGGCGGGGCVGEGLVVAVDAGAWSFCCMTGRAWGRTIAAVKAWGGGRSGGRIRSRVR